MLVESILFSVLLAASAGCTPIVRRLLPLSADNVIRIIMPTPVLLLAAGMLAAGGHSVAAVALGYSGLQLAVFACWFVPTRRSQWSRFERQFWAHVRKTDSVSG